MERDKGKSSRTLARYTAAIRSLYRYLLEENKCDDDPTVFITSPKIEQKLPYVVSQKKLIEALAKNTENKILLLRDKAIIEVLYGSGLRVSELIRLSLNDVSSNLGYIRSIGKGNKERIVPVGQQGLLVIEKYTLSSRRILLSRNKKPSINDRNTLFLNNSGKSLSRQGVWLILKKWF